MLYILKSIRKYKRTTDSKFSGTAASAGGSKGDANMRDAHICHALFPKLDDGIWEFVLLYYVPLCLFDLYHDKL